MERRKHAKLRFTIALILFIIGLSSIIFALIMQSILIYQKLGFVLEQAFIPHWSAYFLFGIIPVILSFFVI